MKVTPQRLHNLFILFTILLGTTLFVGARKNKPAPNPPNVVLFFMDDMGYGDLGSTGA